MSCECECRFEVADTSLCITLLDGRHEITVYWDSLPRVGESVSLESLVDDDDAAIYGIVSSVQWRQVRGTHGNPIILIGINGFNLDRVRVLTNKQDHTYGLEWFPELGGGVIQKVPTRDSATGAQLPSVAAEDSRPRPEWLIRNRKTGDIRAHHASRASADCQLGYLGDDFYIDDPQPPLNYAQSAITRANAEDGETPASTDERFLRVVE